MSLTGNTYYASQNLENTHPLSDITINIDNLQNDIIQNTNDISQNTTDITTNTTAIETNTTDITSNTTSINTLNTQCTDITYDSPSDTTLISNRLKILAQHDWENNQSRRAQFILQNNTTRDSGKYDTQIYSGSMYGTALQSQIDTIVGSTTIINTRTGAINDSKSIVLTGYFPNEKRGMKIALNGDNSEYHGNSFIFYNKIFIQPPGSLMMDVYTHFFTLSQNYTNMLVVVDQNTSDITDIQTENATQNTNINTNTSDITDIQVVNTTQDTRLLDLEAKTMFQTSNGTNETRFTSHVHGVNFYSWDNRYNGGSTSIISNYQEILILQTVNTTQNTRLTNNENINTTQTNDISSLHSDMLDNRGDIVINQSDIVNNANDILAIQTVNTTQTNDIDAVELKTRHQSSTYNTTIFNFTVQAVDCFGYNTIQGNCSIIRNKILITDIQTENATQNTNISNNTSDITDIQTINTTQNTNISTNTSDITSLDSRVAINENNTPSTTNVLLVEEFMNYISLTAGVSGTSSLQWKNYSTLGNSSTKMFTDVNQLGHPGIVQLYLPSTPFFANYQVHCGLNNMIFWADLSSTQIIFKIPSGLTSNNFKVVVGVSNSNALTKSAVWTSTNNGYFKASVNNGATLKTSTKFNFNVGNWIMSTTTRTSTGCIMELTQPQYDVASSKETYTYTGTGISSSDLITPWLAIYEISGNQNPKYLLLDYVSINIRPLRNNT
jgi:hypothetical protein